MESVRGKVSIGWFVFYNRLKRTSEGGVWLIVGDFKKAGTVDERLHQYYKNKI